MLSKDEMLQLRRSYIEIGKLVQKYGGYERYSVELKYLMSQAQALNIALHISKGFFCER